MLRTATEDWLRLVELGRRISVQTDTVHSRLRPLEDRFASMPILLALLVRFYLRAAMAETLSVDPSSSRGLAVVNDWLFDRAHLPVRFFGDLDYAGMQILASLREVFPDATAWQPGYAELLSVIASGGGHPPEAANKERQADPEATGCAYADEVLLTTLRRVGRFVDQEAFGVEQR